MLQNSYKSIETSSNKVTHKVTLKNQVEMIGSGKKEKCGEKSHARIMIVDDVIFNIDILKDILEKVLKVDVKNDVIEAYNGK